MSDQVALQALYDEKARTPRAKGFRIDDQPLTIIKRGDSYEVRAARGHGATRAEAAPGGARKPPPERQQAHTWTLRAISELLMEGTSPTLDAKKRELDKLQAEIEAVEEAASAPKLRALLGRPAK